MRAFGLLFILSGVVATQTPQLPPPVPQASPGTAPESIGIPHSCAYLYPPNAIRLAEEGATTLAFEITAEGTVTDVKLKESSGYNDLDEAAASCVSQWRYQPAIQNGAPIIRPWTVRVVWVPKPTPEDVELWKMEAVAYDCIAALQAVDAGRAKAVTVLNIHLEQGNVSAVDVVESSGEEKLDDAAAQCFNNSRYSETVIPTSLSLFLSIAWTEEAIRNHRNSLARSIYAAAQPEIRN